MGQAGGVPLGINQGLCYKGAVSAPGTVANSFIVPAFAGLGTGKFDGATNPYQCFVMRKGTGTGLAPQGEKQPVTAFNSVTGQITTTAFTVAVAVGDEILLIHPDLSASLLTSGLDAVYFDALNGVAGTTYPQGTAQFPVNNLADVMTIATARNLRVIRVRGPLVLTQDTPGYTFIGESPSGAIVESVTIGAFDVSSCRFHDLVVTINATPGAFPGFACRNCVVNGNFIVAGMTVYNSIVNAVHTGSIVAIYNSVVNGIVGDPLSGGGTTISLYGCKGYCNVLNLTVATDVITVFGDDITLELSASCVTDTVNIYGAARVIDHSAGTVVNDYSNANKVEGLFYKGVVTAIGANQFTIPTLAGLGASKFADLTNPYYAFVLRDAGGAGAKPQGEQRAITTYTNATGVFVTTPFTAAVAIGDEILIMHPSLAKANNITTLGEPSEQMFETWQDEVGINAARWVVTNPATGVPWDRGVTGAYLRAWSVPNLNEVTRLRGVQRWAAGPGVWGTNTIYRRLIVEFSMRLTNVANIDNAETLFGLSIGAASTRNAAATTYLIGWVLLADALNSLTKNGATAANETENVIAGAPVLTNWHKYRMEIYAGHVLFILDEVQVADHTVAGAAALPNGVFYPQFYLDTEAGGTATPEIGPIDIHTERIAR